MNTPVLLVFNGEDVAIYSCLEDAEKWLDSAELDSVSGLGEFYSVDYSNGSTHCFGARRIG